ncbi:sirohydrochlorin cobaltochelatase [Seleniivibrio woodruffii]|uniref:sirohydrochlorin cobaltochelatase n=1 Tax=Seleniivibrio woodruffii TaxID=1078050 RepID=UPI00240A5F62|nr:sirohydrochlorin cobaltochelatase [Seleniivibrio woodruffii]
MRTLFTSVLMLLFAATGVFASEVEMEKDKTAVVIAAFGTTYESTLDSLLKIEKDVKAAVGENVPVRMAFTSNIIRKVWHKRQDDAGYKASHKGKVPDYLYDVKNVLGTMADLQNEGYRNIVVQPTYLTAGEEYADLVAYVEGLGGIKTMKDRWKPFNHLAVGDPIMGSYDYRGNLEALAKALKKDIDAAAASSSALVYMGHGNEHLSTGIYYELERLLNQTYPNVKTYIGVVEGHPELDEVVEKLKRDKVKKVLLKPLMIVAGDHANNDMAGDEDDSWKVVLTKAGIKVNPVLEGLGDNPEVRRIIVENLLKAAKEADIELK